MAHLDNSDFLLMQRDMKEIFKGLSRVGKERRSKKELAKKTCKSLDRGYEDFSLGRK